MLPQDIGISMSYYNYGEWIFGIVKMRCPVNVLNKSGQIKVVFRKQQAHRLEPSLLVLAPLGMVGNFGHRTAPDGLSQSPEALRKPLSMVRFDIIKPLICQDLFQKFSALRRCAAVKQFVQDRVHLCLRHGAAVQQDLAYCQQLPAGEEGLGGRGQLISLLLCVVQDFPGRILPGKKIAQTINVPLDAALVDSKAGRSLFLLQTLSTNQSLIQIQQAAVLIRLHATTSCLYHSRKHRQFLSM